MEYLISHIALYLAAIGVLGLVLGWWLGHGGARSGVRQSLSDLEQRAEAAETESEQKALEASALAGQIAGLEGEARESGDQVRRVAEELAEAQECLELERQRVASFEPLLAKRDTRIEELRAEVGSARERAMAIESDLEPAQKARELLELELAAAQAHTTELETQAREEAGRLDRLESELQIWKERNRDQDEALDASRSELAEAGEEQDRVHAELAELKERLHKIELESESHDMAARAAKQEIETQRQRLRHRDQQITTLLADVGSGPDHQLEVDGLRGELVASVQRVEELRQRAETAETARLVAERERDQATHELEALLSAPLVDVDRMATVKPAAMEGPHEAGPEVAHPELLDVPRGAADDLQRIRGIGEVLEQTLNEIGVYHFRQIAKWSESDIQWVAAHIDTFPDRIVRDGWREQAAELDREHRPT